jgi:L-malate glycosyltransferase
MNRGGLKIAVLCHASSGGSGILATDLAMALAERGHAVHMVCSDRPYRLPDPSPVTVHEVNTVEYPLFTQPPYNLCLINALAQLIDSEGIDVVHAHYLIPHAICAAMARCITKNDHVKVVTTLHGTDVMVVGSHPDLNRTSRWALEKSDTVTAVSKWLARMTSEHFEGVAEPRVVPNFIDEKEFYVAGRDPWPESGAFRVLHVSNFRPVKRVSDVVHVFHRIHAEFPGARLTMIGDGPDLAPAQGLVVALGIRDAVEFRGGVREDIGGCYRGSHLTLVPSEYESCSLSAVEALACGCPVVASRSGGLIETLDGGRVGALCEVGDTRAMAEASIAILGDPDRWDALSGDGVVSVARRFDKDMAVDAYEAVYRELVERPTAG